MKMIVELLAIETNKDILKKDGSGTFKVTELVCKSVNGKVFTKRILAGSLARNPELSSICQVLKAGQTLTLTTQLENGYENINKIEVGTGEQASITKSTKDSGRGEKANQFTRAKMDPEERESVVFQNSLAHATAILIHNAGKSPVEVKEVLELAGIIAKKSLHPNLFGANAELKKVVKSHDIELSWVEEEFDERGNE